MTVSSGRAHPRSAIVCLSTADWDAALWTNKQQLMSRLAAAGTPVLYVDSPGHRVPAATSQDARRMLHRLAVWRPFASLASPGLWRDSPLVLPFHGRPGVDLLNRQLMLFRLWRNRHRLGLARPVMWAYSPLAADLYTPDHYAGLVYHCVDDLAQFPGVDPDAFRRMETRLVRRANVTVVSSSVLAEHVESLGARDVRYWPNPADVSAIRAAEAPSVPRTRPRIGFIGAVQDHKMDTDLLRRVALDMPEADFVIGGPMGAGIARHQLDVCSFPANVSFPGLVSRPQVPGFLADLDVGVIPYRINSYTRSVFPLKIFEYFAAGLPVVSTPLPSLVGEVAEVRLAADPQEFVRELRLAIEGRGDVDARRRRLDVADSHSWEARCAEALLLLDEIDPPVRSPRHPALVNGVGG